MLLLPLPKNISTCIYCVTDDDKRWIGLTKNYFRAYAQFKKSGKVNVSDQATFQVLEFVPDNVAQQIAEMHCQTLRAKMMPARKGVPVIKYDPSTGGEFEYDNIIKACADLDLNPGTLRRAIKENKAIGGYKFKYSIDR